MLNRIGIIGGDLRIVKLIEMLSEDGFEVYMYGLENAESLMGRNRVFQCQSIEEVVNQTRIIIGPIPLSSNGLEINMPFSEEKITINELLESVRNKTLIAGAVKEDLYNKAQDVEIIDILKREELSVLNTISTAEGAIQIAMEETPTTIHGSNILIMGFGRIGKILAKMLDGIGAKVTCEARKDTDIAWIKAYGYESIYLNEVEESIGSYDVIINTIPYVILHENQLRKVKKDTLLIDLASNPGGIDKKAAKELGLKLVWALSLPGKVAPNTSAKYIKDTLYNILKEMNKGE